MDGVAVRGGGLGRVFIYYIVLLFMFNPKRLKVLDRAIELVPVIERLTNRFPKREDYELGSQIRRAAKRIASNIDEGNSRGIVEYIYFLKCAIGSCNEVETQLKMVFKLGYVEDAEFEKVKSEVIEIRRMLFGVIKFLEKKKKVEEEKKKGKA